MMKPDDMQYFDKLLVDVDEETLTPEEQKDRKIMKLLLKIKNGTPPMRKVWWNLYCICMHEFPPIRKSGSIYCLLMCIVRDSIIVKILIKEMSKFKHHPCYLM